MRVLVKLLLLVLSTGEASAQTVLRLASIAPDGTAWAHEMRAFAADVGASSHGSLQVRWSFGGIAGDEMEADDRLKRGQLDGIASGGMLCQARVAPSFGVLRVQGLFQTPEEAWHVLSRMNVMLRDEARARGYALVGTTVLGSDAILARTPIQSMADLKKLRLWRWDLDDYGIAYSRAMGLNIVATPVAAAARAFDEGRIDGFVGIPAAMMAFQWYTRAHYLVGMRLSLLPGCLIMSVRSWDRLTTEQQSVMTAAAAKLRVRMNRASLEQENALINGAFQKAGVKPVTPDASFRAGFFDAARHARETEGTRMIPADLLRTVQAMLADYRAEHGPAAKD